MFEWFQNIIKRMFSRGISQSSGNVNQSQKDAQKYFDVSEENITAMVSNALSILSFGDGSVVISSTGGSTKRTEYLNKIAQKEFAKAKRKISAALGVGMIASIPYCADNGLGRKIYIDTITKDRFFITGLQGDEITDISAIAEIVSVGTKKYMRWTDYSVNSGIYIIRNKATDEHGTEIPLARVEKWATIPPEIAINGVDRLPVAFYSCPAGNRQPETIGGVPITFGCDAILEKIKVTLEDIEREFNKKRVKLLVPRFLLTPQKDEKGKVVGEEFKDDLFVKLAEDDENNIVVFDPSIRESSYFAKLQYHFSMLEKAIGCSKGILTELLTQGATATEIRRAMNATFCLTDDIRKEYVRYFEDLMYAVNVLCNYYSITPVSEYSIDFEWSYSLLEDSEQTFRQLKEGKAEGAISTIEIRQFLKPEESPEDAQKAIEDIKKNEPSLKSLIGVE